MEIKIYAIPDRSKKAKQYNDKTWLSGIKIYENGRFLYSEQSPIISISKADALIQAEEMKTDILEYNGLNKCQREALGIK